MSRPANTVAIGAFVTGAVLVLFSLLFYVSGGFFNRDTELGLMVFDGSVKGLKLGAPVAFKGVQIGEVIDFDVIIDSDTYEVLTPVVVRVNANKIKRTGTDRGEKDIQVLIDRGLRAQLQVQSLLTGLLYVQLDFQSDKEQRYGAEALAKYEIEEDYIIVPTVPTEMERLSSSLDQADFGAMIDNITRALASAEALLSDPELQSLAGNLNETLDAVELLSTRLKTEVDTLSPGVGELIADADITVEQINRDLPEVMESLSAALQSAQSTLGNIDYLLSDDSAVLFDVRKAAVELGAAGRALQSLAETLETQPESLLKGKSPLGN